MSAGQHKVGPGSPKCVRNQPDAATSSQEQPKATRSSQEQPEEPKADRSRQKQPEATTSSQIVLNKNYIIFKNSEGLVGLGLKKNIKGDQNTTIWRRIYAI